MGWKTVEILKPVDKSKGVKP